MLKDKYNYGEVGNSFSEFYVINLFIIVLSSALRARDYDKSFHIDAPSNEEQKHYIVRFRGTDEDLKIQDNSPDFYLLIKLPRDYGDCDVEIHYRGDSQGLRSALGMCPEGTIVWHRNISVTDLEKDLGEIINAIVDVIMFDEVQELFRVYSLYKQGKL